MSGCEVKTTIAIRPAPIDLVVQRGTDSPVEFVITDGSAKAIDITLDTIRFTVRKSVAGPLVFQKTNSAGQHSEPVAGRTAFDIKRTDIDNEASETRRERWVYEVRRILSTGDERVHITGAFIVEPTVEP